MQAAEPQSPGTLHVPLWLRAHRALMPDYNRKATAYWWLVVLVGATVLVYALRTVLALPARDLLQLSAGVAIAMIAGLFPVRIPRSKNSFAAGEIFIFLLLLLHGPAAAALAAAGEGLIGSWRTSKRWTSRIASPAMASIAMFGTGSLLHAGIGQLHGGALDNAGVLLLGTMASAVLYFVVNTVLITAVPFLKRNQWPRLAEMFGNFGWIGITFAGSASVACLLFMSFEQTGIAVLLGAVPVIALLLAALHTLFRQQETDEEVRQSRVAAVEREAELSARHVRELEVSERRFHSAFSHASIGMALVSFDARVLQVNAALCTLLGITDEQAIVHQAFSKVVADEHVAMLNDELMRLNAHQTVSFAVELRLRHSGGGEVWATVHGSIFAEQGAGTPCLSLQVQDVTARRQAEAGLQQLAFHDSLTGLPNRRRFQELLAHALARSKREPHRQFALMFLDFDRFKLINDSLGHAVGDEFLVAVARRIQQQLRPHDLVARLGGDEFAVLAEDLDSGRYAVSLADRLLAALRQPIQLAGTDLTTSASIGITFSSLGYVTPEDMLRDADTAMYKAKSAGKARYALFDSALHTEVAHRMRLEGELRHALSGGQLSVAYQPLFDLRSGSVIGFEALARWLHPELGAISPVTFIPIAEDTGLMPALTDFVLRSACGRLAQWQQRDAKFAGLTMNVNVSSNDIAHPGLVARVNAALVEARVQPQFLTLELTENILMKRLEAAIPTLSELRRLGIGLSVDDFGTGYSSLQHLSSLPVNSLKVDRAFIAGLRHGSNHEAIVRAILLMGQSLGKAVTAEGIETPEQMEQLLQMGCATGQGFHLSRPLAPELVGELLEGLVASALTVPGHNDERPSVFH